MPSVEPRPLTEIVALRRRPGTAYRSVRRWYVFAAIVNFVATLPFLVNSVLHHVFDVPPSLLTWARDEPPTRPFIFWTFLGFGVLWGVFFLYIAAEPVARRPWMYVAAAEKLLASIVVWADCLFFHNLGVGLPLIMLGTDLAFVVVFGWTIRATRDGVDAMARDPATRVPVGSAPPARWLLRVVSFPTIVVAGVAVVASLVKTASPPVGCREPHPIGSCTVLGTTNLWSDPPFVVWLWGGMASIIAAAMLWASADVVRRRDIIGFGAVARLIPVAAVAVGRFSDRREWRPTTDFLRLVIVGELLAAFMTWLALRSANASALALGDDLEVRPTLRKAPS